MSKRNIKDVAVFYGSNFGATDTFVESAKSPGTALTQSSVTLVDDGTAKGLAGVAAGTALTCGGTVHGIATRRLHERGHLHPGPTHHEIVPSLVARKERMAELMDAFVAMPGGIEATEEFLEA